MRCVIMTELLWCCSKISYPSGHILFNVPLIVVLYEFYHHVQSRPDTVYSMSLPSRKPPAPHKAQHWSHTSPTSDRLLTLFQSHGTMLYIACGGCALFLLFLLSLCPLLDLFRSQTKPYPPGNPFRDCLPYIYKPTSLERHFCAVVEFRCFSLSRLRIACCWISKF